MILPQPLAANFLQNQRALSFSQIGELGSIAALGSVVLMLAFGHLKTSIAMLIGEMGVLVYALLLWQGDSFFLYGLA